MVAAYPNGNGFSTQGFNPPTYQGSVPAQFAATKTPNQPPAIYAQARDASLVSQIYVSNGDASGSVYHLGQIPSDAIIDPRSTLYAQANASLTSLSIGVSGSGGQAVAAGVANCILNALNVAAGGSFAAGAALYATPANAQYRAWQLAGLAADPGGNLEIYATVNAAVTANGYVTFVIDYWRNA